MPQSQAEMINLIFYFSFRNKKEFNSLIDSNEIEGKMRFVYSANFKINTIHGFRFFSFGLSCRMLLIEIQMKFRFFFFGHFG